MGLYSLSEPYVDSLFVVRLRKLNGRIRFFGSFRSQAKSLPVVKSQSPPKPTISDSGDGGKRGEGPFVILPSRQERLVPFIFNKHMILLGGWKEKRRAWEDE